MHRKHAIIAIATAVVGLAGLFVVAEARDDPAEEGWIPSGCGWEWQEDGTWQEVQYWPEECEERMR